MKKTKAILLSLIIFLNSIIFTGCWNYREIDTLAIVAGVAIDKDDNKDLSMTMEIVEFRNEKESKISSRVITIRGKTIFDTARNGVSYLGKRLYWSHAKVFIISEQVAYEGITKVIDWINRDSETRPSISILVAKGHSAKEILQSAEKKKEIESFEMRKVIDNQRVLSKAPKTESWEMINSIENNGITGVAPVVELKTIDGEKTPRIMGTAIFRKDKLIGFLNSEETKDMLFVQNKIEGGVLVQRENIDNKDIPISLEIFDSKTKIEPELNDNNINYNIKINITAAIDELGGTKDFINEDGRKELEEATAKMLKIRIERLIMKVQQDYGTDIFGFGAKLKEDKPKVWKSKKNKWEEEFKNIHANVSVNVHIRNSAMLSKPLEVGD